MTMQYLIDWDKNGNFTGTYDDVTADVLEARWFIGARNPYQNVCDEPTIELVLNNANGKYSPENGASPIAGKIVPYVRIRVLSGTTQMWNGYLDAPELQWQPLGDATGKHTITLKGVGAKQLLDAVTVVMPTLTDVTADQILYEAISRGSVFSALQQLWLLGDPVWGALGVSTYLAQDNQWRDFETGITIFPDYIDGREGVWSIIRDVCETERGKFDIGRDGRYVFKNRHYTYYSEVTDYTVDEDETVGLSYLYGDVLATRTTVSARPRRTEASEQLWELDNPITIAPSQTISLEARLRRPNGQFASSSGVTPSATFSSGTADVTVTTKAGVAEITIENNTLYDAVLSTLTLSGTPLYPQNQLTVTAEDEVLARTYGVREKRFSVGNLYEWQDINDIAHMELLRSPLRGRIASLNMIASADDNAVMVDDLQLGAFIQVDAPSLYHDDRYLVIGEQHQWGEGNIHRAEFFLEPVDRIGMQLDTVGRMELGINTIVIY